MYRLHVLGGWGGGGGGGMVIMMVTGGSVIMEWLVIMMIDERCSSDKFVKLSQPCTCARVLLQQPVRSHKEWQIFKFSNCRTNC
jgi:hypothetical protein